METLQIHVGHEEEMERWREKRRLEEEAHIDEMVDEMLPTLRDMLVAEGSHEAAAEIDAYLAEKASGPES